MSPADRRTLVDRDDPVLPVVAQCRLLKIARSTLYYQPTPVDPDDLAVMRRMDELYLASPFYGSRRMAAVLRREGVGYQPQAGAAADAGDGVGGDLPEAKHQPRASRSQGISVPVAGSEHRPAKPSVVRGHHLYSDGEGICLPGGCDLAFRSRHVNVPKRRDGLV
jgi:hypothetical protein